MKPVLESILQQGEKEDGALQLYRKLGQLENSFTNPEYGALALHMSVLLEAWAILRLENTDLPLRQLCPAGEVFVDHSADLLQQGKRVMHILTERFFPISSVGAQQLYISIKETDSITFRSQDLWIGGTSTLNARYVAPTAGLIIPSLDSLSSLFETQKIDIVHELGRLHAYSFLLLPFPKDNARWASLWTHALAKQIGLPQTGLLAFTHGILHHRQQYSSDLLACAAGSREAWDATWLQCTERAVDAAILILAGARMLVSSTLQHEESFGKAKKHLRPLLKHLARCPYVNIHDLCAITKLTKPNATHFLNRCLDIGLLKQVTFEHRNRVYVAPSIVQLLEGC